MPRPLVDTLARDPAIAEITGPVVSVQRLKGLTNHVFRLMAETGSYVLRVPRFEQVWAIDRAGELHDHRVAARLGVAVEVLYADPTTGVLLLPAIDETGPVTPEALGICLGTLHGSEASFAAHRDLGQYLDECESGIADVSEFAAQTAPLVLQVRRLLVGQTPVSPVPCHFDPAPANLLVTGNHLLLIDFEYAAMAPAAWDLAYASLENGFSGSQESRFMAAYAQACGSMQIPSTDELQAFKAICDTVSMLWALGQVKVGNDAANFQELADMFRRRAEEAIRGL